MVAEDEDGRTNRITRAISWMETTRFRVVLIILAAAFISPEIQHSKPKLTLSCYSSQPFLATRESREADDLTGTIHSTRS